MNKILAFVLATLLTATVLPLSASADATQDIPSNAIASGVHDSLVAALTHADLVATLQGPGPFTVFAPTDQAFINAGINLEDYDTPEENQTLRMLLLHHVVSGEVASSDLKDGMMTATMNGDYVKFGVGGGTVTVGAATVTFPDVQASNGIIHFIDTVLTPPVDIPTTAQATGIHDSLVAAVIQADLAEARGGTGPFTVFAPTDQAFIDANIDPADFTTAEGKKTLSDILLYHVVSAHVPAVNVTDCMIADTYDGHSLAFSVGDSVMVNDANITMTDVIASNGLIHVIDKVLTSPTDTPNDVPRTAQCDGDHNTLVDAVIQAELLEALQGPGPFTVFAPTDQALADANIDLSDNDTPEGKDALANLLEYHVVPGTVLAADVENCMTATAVNGQPLSFSVSDTVMVNNAVVTATDAMASNGVIHVIDTVLTPTDTPNNIATTAGCTSVHTFTVCAPTDEAVAAANIDLAALDTPEDKQALRNILLYHVYNGTVNGADVTDETKLRMMNGNDAVVRLTDGALSIEGATITTGDVIASNGVIHVIDAVLTPPENVEDESTSAGAADGEINWLLYGGIALVVIVLAGLLVARFIGRGSDDLETIQPIGGTDTLAAQPDAQTTAQATTAAAYGAGGTQAAAAQTYQPEAYQQAYQPVAAQPVAKSYDESALDAFVQEDPVQATATFQPVAQAAVDVQPAQAVAPQPVSAPEPKVVNQWTDANGHTWRVMSDGTNRWWNGTDWQKV